LNHGSFCEYYENDRDSPITLIDSLRQIVGADGVISNADELLVYECDAFTMEKNLPNVVVLPRSTEQVVAVVKLCASEGMPIIPRGAGTSLSGGVLPVEGGVMIALTRMNKILSVDFENRRALVEAGCCERMDHERSEVSRVALRSRSFQPACLHHWR
jgi:glycolate oxidase